MDKFQKAIAPPFNLEKCLNIADAQYNGMYVVQLYLHHLRSYATWVAFLDEILFLRDPDLFINKVMVEVGARTPPKNGKKQPPALNKPAFVADAVATRYVPVKVHSGLTHPVILESTMLTWSLPPGSSSLIPSASCVLTV